eukprot:9415997-Pyramimonas_sp.AAC.1
MLLRGRETSLLDASLHALEGVDAVQAPVELRLSRVPEAVRTARLPRQPRPHEALPAAARRGVPRRAGGRARTRPNSGEAEALAGHQHAEVPAAHALPRR